MALSDVCTSLKKNKGGAPRGNTNALKHGFYSPRFQNKDLQSLSSYEFRGLEEEIGLVRLAMKNVCDAFADENTKEESAHFLMLACTASATLNRLIRTQAALKLDDAIVASALSEALEQVLEEMRADPEPGKPAPIPRFPQSPITPMDGDEDEELTSGFAFNASPEADPFPSFAAFLASEAADAGDPSPEQTVHLSDSGFSGRGEAFSGGFPENASPSPIQASFPGIASPAPVNPAGLSSPSPAHPEVVSGCFTTTPPPKKKRPDPPYAAFRYHPSPGEF
jgi:hypothetical protein